MILLNKMNVEILPNLKHRLDQADELKGESPMKKAIFLPYIDNIFYQTTIGRYYVNQNTKIKKLILASVED